MTAINGQLNKMVIVLFKYINFKFAIISNTTHKTKLVKATTVVLLQIFLIYNSFQLVVDRNVKINFVILLLLISKIFGIKFYNRDI